jgi:hypothetical protein
MSVCGQRHAPAIFLPERDPVPIAQDAGSGLVRKFWPPDPRTFQLAASRCTDCDVPARESAKESVAISDLSSIASVRKQDEVSESEFVSVNRWKCPETLTGLVRRKELLLQDGQYQSAASSCRFCPREAKKCHTFTVTHVQIPMKTFTGSRKEKYLSCRSGAPQGMAQQFHLQRRIILVCHLQAYIFSAESSDKPHTSEYK